MTRGILSKNAVIYEVKIIDNDIVVRREDGKVIRNPIKSSLKNLGFSIKGNQAFIEFTGLNVEKTYSFMCKVRYSVIHDEMTKKVFYG